MAAYEVWLKGFAAGVADPVPELMRLFRISEERARKLANAVPVVVKRNTTQEIAEKFCHSLQHIGGVVEVRESVDGETSGTFSQRPPSRSARSVAPSTRRTGRGVDRHSSVPEMPAFDGREDQGLPRRRHSSSATPALELPSSSPPPRRPSSPAMVALNASAPGPRRRSNPTMPAESGLVAAALRGEAADDRISVPFGDDAPPRRQNATVALGSPVAVRPPTIPAVVARPLDQPQSFPPAPPTPEEVMQMQSASSSDRPAFAGSGMPAPPTRPRAQLSAPPPPMPGASPHDKVEPPPSRVPRTLSAAPPPMSGAPPPLADGAPALSSDASALAPLKTPSFSTVPPPGGMSIGAAGALIAVGVLCIVWRVWTDSSVFQGKASWTFGVWLESVALAMAAAGVLRIAALRDDTTDAEASANTWVVAGVVPIALLLNWGIASTLPPPVIPGGLDARLEVINKIADACERTAKDEPSCSACCETKMVFAEVCECIVPWHCVEGDESPDACRTCCAAGGAPISYELIPQQGCVCNPELLAE